MGDSIKLNSGYGRVSRSVLSYFSAKGHDVTQIAWSHTEPPEIYDVVKNNKIISKIKIVPVHTSDSFGIGTTIYYINKLKPDILYNSNDYFTIQPLISRAKDLITYPRIVNYGIIDGPECARCYKDIIQKIDYPVVPSMYGLNQISSVNLKAYYIPHGVDLNIFKPVNDKDRIKEIFGLKNKFIFGVVNRNIWRKMFPFLFKAFSDIKKDIKDACLFVIADPNDPLGFNVFYWCNLYNLKVGIAGKDKDADVYLHPEFINAVINLTDNELANIYNTFDVFVSASTGEGFGLGTIESQACGVPSILCNHSANTELVEGHGWLYDICKNSDGSPVLVPPTIPINWITYYYYMPDVSSLSDAMLDAYNNTSKLKKYSKESIKFSKSYDWDLILPQWDKAINI